MRATKGDHPVATLIAEKITALLNAELATVMSNSYRRGTVDQFYQPLSEESIVRIRKALEAEGVTDPSWPFLDARALESTEYLDEMRDEYDQF